MSSPSRPLYVSYTTLLLLHHPISTGLSVYTGTVINTPEEASQPNRIHSEQLTTCREVLDRARGGKLSIGMNRLFRLYDDVSLLCMAGRLVQSVHRPKPSTPFILIYVNSIANEQVWSPNQPTSQIECLQLPSLV